MNVFGASTESAYGDVYAEVYDDLFARRDDLDQLSRVLREFVDDGRALEFGIGTGRIALPLAKLGVRVYGLDNSAAMLEKLRAKDGADRIVAKVGSFVSDGVDETFSLVFCVFSTLYQITEQEDQVRTFANAARHLKPGGKFIVENFVQDRRRFLFDQEVTTTHVAPTMVELRAAQLNPAEQIIELNRMVITESGVKFYPNRMRFIHPSEMDLMARLNGFAVRARWSGWNRAPYGAASGNYIGVYEKVA